MPTQPPDHRDASGVGLGSRARIIAAADDARRRLARDLHDGAQQRLVIASLWLKRAATQARGTPAEPLLDEAFAQLQHGLAELRDLANAAKHARASLVRVDVDVADGALVAEVADDGVGGATTAGSGLRGLADRLDTLDGTLVVHSPRGAGTTVRARVPLPG